MAEHPWSWRDKKNPYRGTPFQVLDLGVDVAGRGPIERVIQKRRRRIESTPERFPLFGEVLDVAQVNTAADAVRAPAERLYAELCTHRVRRGAAMNLSGISSALEDIPAVEPSEPLAVSLDRLARYVPVPAPRTFDPILEW